MVALPLALSVASGAAATSRGRSIIRGGVLIAPDTTQVESVVADSLAVERAIDSLAMSEVGEMGEVAAADSIDMREVLLDDTLAITRRRVVEMDGDSQREPLATRSDGEVRNRFLSDSMSLSRMCWTSVALPGFGQIYNKQYWKLPILYGALAAGTTLYVKESQRYKPLKAEYDDITMESVTRTDYLNSLQADMIRSNTRRQLYLGATIATYIYALGDAAVNYSTNDTSDIKRATTLATIFPGAGQIYNKQYWKVPFVVGGFATMIYVVDWNNRGYQRFKKAYIQITNYENNPDDYPDGSPDEFGGRYSADYMESLRDSYRRSRDLSIIMLAGLYILQIIDAHVDAHFQDYDISDDLAMNIEPLVSYSYSPVMKSDRAVFGFNVGFKF